MTRTQTARLLARRERRLLLALTGVELTGSQRRLVRWLAEWDTPTHGELAGLFTAARSPSLRRLFARGPGASPPGPHREHRAGPGSRQPRAARTLLPARWNASMARCNALPGVPPPSGRTRAGPGTSRRVHRRTRRVAPGRPRRLATPTGLVLVGPGRRGRRAGAGSERPHRRGDQPQGRPLAVHLRLAALGGVVSALRQLQRPPKTPSVRSGRDPHRRWCAGGRAGRDGYRPWKKLAPLPAART
jgi:hypothetical protein